jgi:methyl-accepting chemotaxis protein
MFTWIRTLPIWARIVGAFVVVMAFATGAMIFWGIRQQRQIALEQADAFAAASTHMAYTALGLAMASGDSKEIGAVVGQLQKSQGIKALRIVPTESVKQQFKMGNAPQTDALEQRVLQDGKPHFGMEKRGAALVYRAIMPLKASRNFIGRDCTTCHQVPEETVLGAVSLDIGLDQLQQASSDFQNATVIAAFGLGAIFVLAFYYLCRRIIARPLDEVVCQLKDMSQGEGDLTKRLAVRNDDEIGELAKWFNQFVEKIQKTVWLIGDNVQSLASSAEELTAVSHQMAGNAEETAAQSNVVSAASEQVSKNVQTVAAGAEEMTASIKEIAKNTNDAARVAKEAVAVAEQTNQTITKLGVSSAEIGNVIKVITSIAEQTNLLALNATIEAARAGAAGKGFAVVANEVKELAKQTGHATEDIGNKISAIQQDTQGAVAAIQQIGRIINQINDIANTIASAVEEQTVTTNEMARNVEEAAKGSNEIVQNITGVAQAAQSTASGATQTQAAAQELARLASELQGALNQFKYDDSAQEPKALVKAKETARKALPVKLQATYRPATSSLETR